MAFFDMSWLAVRGADPRSLLAPLELSHPVAVTWEQGLEAVCGDFWDIEAPLDSHLARVFLTPQVGDWVLAIGGWFGGSEELGLRGVAELCRSLSRSFGQ